MAQHLTYVRCLGKELFVLLGSAEQLQYFLAKGNKFALATALVMDHFPQQCEHPWPRGWGLRWVGSPALAINPLPTRVSWSGGGRDLVSS